MKSRRSTGIMILSGMLAQIGWNMVRRAVEVNSVANNTILIGEGILDPLEVAFIKTSKDIF
jgi:hypothetical protein